MATAAVALPTSALSGKIDTNGSNHGEDKGKKSKNLAKKLRKKKQKQNRNQKETSIKGENDEKENVEVEYIVANLTDEIDRSDPNYAEFAGIFERFKSMEETKIVEEVPGEADKPSNDDAQKNDEETDENGVPKVSNKQKKKLKRPSLAVLKQLVKRPDVVEAWDVTAADPFLLVYLKSYRNAVPVPRHWNQKRRYLQGKRGIEKPPFNLPDFIAATGISKIRQAIQEKDAHKSVKQKQRDKMSAKVGRMDIDYQVLHDAFFKYQTKPKLTYHGDLYYEGKEFEITLKEKKPGHLSEDLKRALGMPEGAPPPWLINMQRFGPPPAYPNLKIPGLNAPIPEGARYGFHPGGWGKPPVDEFGRPLYGDVFGTNPEPPPEISQPIDKKHWGEIEDVPEEEVEEEQEEAAADNNEEEEPHPSGLETPSGLATPSGMETPDSLELRKGQKKDKGKEVEEDDSGKQLYQVLEQKETAVGSALFGSSHKYVVPSAEQKISKSGTRVDLMKSKATEKIDIALEPGDIEKMENLEDVLKQKYDSALAAKKAVVKEDVSDVIEEHNRQNKRKKDYKDNKDNKKKYKDSKF